MLKTIIEKLKKKKDNDVMANMAQLEHNTNKYNALVFRNI